jgi:small multidrug resistance family-3 protein
MQRESSFWTVRDGLAEGSRMLVKSVLLFIVAGLFEIGGGYLVWQWWRNNAHIFLGLVGGIVLFFYGIVPTYQTAHFGRVYAAYGGWFVILSILWGWGIDRIAPDRYDILGAVVCLAGVAIIMYAPR